MAIKYYKDNSEPVNKPNGVWGYLQGNKVGQKNFIKKVIDAAIVNDIYVIVDWHSHNAHDETNEAKTFFVEMANEYKDVPNLIWEVYNEPVGASSSQVNSHAKTIVDALKAAGNNNLVLIGSPSYSTQPSGQTSAWSSSDNVAFTFHFYAGSHSFPSAGGGSSAQSAMTAGYPVFGSEWGTVNADGGGGVNESSSNTWTNWMDQEKISNCMWNASNLNEGSSMFPTNMGSVNLDATRLTSSGNYFKTYMGKNKWTSLIPNNHPKGNDIVVSSNDGVALTISGTQLGLTGKITGVKSWDQSVPVNVTFTDNSITYQVDGSKKSKIILLYEVTNNNITTQSKITVKITSKFPNLPEKDPIAVSRKAATTLSITTNLGASDPNGGALTLESVSVEPSNIGTVAKSGNNIIFTPAASQHNNTEVVEATLKYKVKNSDGSREQSVTLMLQNFSPSIRGIDVTFTGAAVPNTDPIKVDMARFDGNDADGDAITFSKIYLDPKYPGRLEKVKDDEYTYYPEAGKIGTIVILAVITDGSLSSPVGRTNIKLSGSGTDIGSLTPPTSIPDDIDPPPPPPPPEPPDAVYQFNAARSIGLAAAGFGKVELYLAQSGVAKLDVYSLSGQKMGSLLNGHQSAGSKQVSLGSLNLQKGVYILRLSQGSQVKTLRIVN